MSDLGMVWLRAGCKSFKSEGCETWTLQGLGATGSWGYGGLGAAVSGGSGKVVAATSGYGGYSEARSCRTWELCSLRLQGCVRSGTFWDLGVSESGGCWCWRGELSTKSCMIWSYWVSEAAEHGSMVPSQSQN